MYIKNKKLRIIKTTSLIACVLFALTACSDGSDDDDDGAMATGGTTGMGGTDGDGGTDADGATDGDDDEVQEEIATDGTSDFTVPLSAEQEVPMLDLPTAEGEASFNINKDSGAINGEVTFSGLTGAPTVAHIHQGFAGSVGGPILNLEANADSTAFNIPAGTVLDSAALTQFNEGALYFNVHTAANASGEIRGQIIPEDILLEDTELSGDEMVPVIETGASGFGYSTLNTETGALTVFISVSDLANASTAGLFLGAEGENGDSIAALEQDGTDPSIWRTPEGTVLTVAQMTAFEAESIYVIVTSDTYPNGEIRGQL